MSPRSPCSDSSTLRFFSTDGLHCLTACWLTVLDKLMLWKWKSNGAWYDAPPQGLDVRGSRLLLAGRSYISSTA